MLTLLALALCAPASAAPLTVGLDLMHEAMGIPGFEGINAVLPPLHPGAQAELGLGWVDGDRLDMGPVLRVGGWSHAEIASLAFVSVAPRLSLGLPHRLAVQLEPVEAGFALNFSAGRRYEIGAAGLVEAADPPEARLLLGAGLGLSWGLADLPLALALRYRAAVEYPSIEALPVRWLPHSTLGLGLSWTLGGSPEEVPE